MAVLRIHKKHQNFVILDKTCLNDESLSWGAKGLHAFLLSLPDDWQVRVSDLQTRAKNGRDAVRAFLNELEQFGYIQKSPSRDNSNGRFEGVEYLVLEIPESKNKEITPETEKPSADISSFNSPAPGNPSTENPTPDNPTLLNNKYYNNLNNNNTNSASEFSNPQKTKKTIAPDFQPSPEILSRAFAAGYGFAADPKVIQEFIDKNQSWGSQFADFNPVYFNYLSQYEKYQQKSTGTLRSNRNECHPNQNTTIQTAYERVLQHHQAKLCAEAEREQEGIVIEAAPLEPMGQNDCDVWAAFSKQTWG